MRVTVGEVRRVVRDVIAEAADGGFFYITDPDGKRYVGSRDKIRKALVQYSRADAAEREEVMSTGRASSAVVSALKRAKAIERYVSQAERAAKDELDRKRSSRWRVEAGDNRDSSRHNKQERAYREAVDEFAAQFTDFVLENPDVSPEDAASDLALNFFNEYPEWSEWARMLDMTRQTMKEIVTDYVYDAMMKGAKKHGWTG